MVAVSPFTPATVGTKAITVAATTANVQLPYPGVDQQVMVTSIAANAIAFIAFGNSAVAATVPTGTAGSTPVLPGRPSVFSVGPDVTHIATIGTAANTLYVTCGAGVAP